MQFSRCVECREYKYIEGNGLCPSCYGSNEVTFETNLIVSDKFFEGLEEMGYEYNKESPSRFSVNVDSLDEFYDDMENLIGISATRNLKNYEISEESD